MGATVNRRGRTMAAALSALLWRATASSSRRSARRVPAFPLRPRAFASSSYAAAFQHVDGSALANRSASASSARATATRLPASAVEGARPSSDRRRPVPTVLLAGFLGSGKTSALKHLLENNANVKIGTIVNDVASVNIDAKLVSNSDSARDDLSYAEGGVVELQNGCACCTLADELLTSVERLTRGGERELDAIVVELSGVADPVSVRDNWERAKKQGHPATRLASLERTVTLVDACTFGTDWMTWDVAADRDGWIDGECEGARKVPELLAEQVEAADLLLVNKVDLAGREQVGVASGVARGLNEKATLVEVEFGRVDARELLGKVLKEEEEEEVTEKDAHSHGHEHSHEHSSEHEHDHDKEASACSDPDCTDTSHSHSHEHLSECDDPDCSDSSHSHSHEHSSECDDPDCTDTSHSHSHDHKSAIATYKLGITSFVYKSSVPFNSQRLLALLNRWPIPIKDSLDFGLTAGMKADVGPGEAVQDEHKAFIGVLRSKGFCWMAPTKWSRSAGGDAWRHDTAMYWSHAGKHFGITSAGKWWGSLTNEQMRPYFAGNMEEYDRIMREDWMSEEWGDRRQELVFIGANFDEGDIRDALDECLCTKEEMDMYRAELRIFLDASSSSARSGPSLFDVGGMDHIEKN
ncbi:hypothetical protein ACHAWF_005746 [Thalassiosira exigua]